MTSHLNNPAAATTVGLAAYLRAQAGFGFYTPAPLKAKILELAWRRPVRLGTISAPGIEQYPPAIWNGESTPTCRRPVKRQIGPAPSGGASSLPPPSSGNGQASAISV